jgi:ankyrin repeat protein
LLDRENFDATLQSEDGFTALIWAVKNGSADAVRVHIPRAEIDINLADKYGNTALIYAASGGYGQIFDLLLSRPTWTVA